MSKSNAIQLLLVAAVITLAAATNYVRGGLDADARKSRQLNLFKEDRIIGGSRAEKDRYPYTVSMQDGSHFCGGSLISRDSHCLGGSYDVRIGSDSVGSGERIEMQREYEHPNYSTRTDEFDIALIKLDRPTNLDVPLVRINDNNNVPATRTTVTVMGWGDTNPSDSRQEMAKNLMEVNLDVISNSQCEKSKKNNDSYNGFIYQSMLCTQTRNKDACQGDSGGPLVIKGNTPEEDIQVGVVSWGIGCAYLPGVFSRVSRAHGWIKKTVCAQSRDPPAELCDLVVETPRPTPRPTPNPTRLPTRPPTASPTEEPTVSPSGNPTDSPTAEPTLAPTNLPSLMPSSSSMPSVSTRPSPSPSGSPSLSAQPSVLPTAAPSVSAMPSSSPSESPSASAMPSVSVMPSDAPSASPSESLAPSLSPSTSPTSSSAPSASVMPSAAPIASSRPSVSPSGAPTPLPTERVSAAILPEDSLLISSAALIEPRDGERTADDVEAADSASVARGAGTMATLCMGVVAAILLII